jgi:hypothetical protein
MAQAAGSEVAALARVEGTEGVTIGGFMEGFSEPIWLIYLEAT